MPVSACSWDASYIKRKLKDTPLLKLSIRGRLEGSDGMGMEIQVVGIPDNMVRSVRDSVYDSDDMSPCSQPPSSFPPVFSLSLSLSLSRSLALSLSHARSLCLPVYLPVCLSVRRSLSNCFSLAHAFIPHPLFSL